ncbi:hypothetical protein F4780DRAFT_792417 [Xylariomycetidae sp. FL0641]|nr:hypothetical protein F4780DRAFT_792417 [Xylariomycetidae sp. FL0641]
MAPSSSSTASGLPNLDDDGFSICFADGLFDQYGLSNWQVNRPTNGRRLGGTNGHLNQSVGFVNQRPVSTIQDDYITVNRNGFGAGDTTPSRDGFPDWYTPVPPAPPAPVTYSAPISRFVPQTPQLPQHDNQPTASKVSAYVPPPLRGQWQWRAAGERETNPETVPPTHPPRGGPPRRGPGSGRRAGMSDNYLGDHTRAENQSADIPDEENCSVWITNLPPGCDHAQLLGAVRGCGKVYACVVNPPVAAPQQQQQQPHIMTAASKLVFFEVAGAARLLRAAREGRFAVGGRYLPQVRRNRIRSAAVAPPGPESRVLHIEGPDAIVNGPYLAAFFDAHFVYQLEAVEVLARSPPGGGGDAPFAQRKTRMEWRFGSYRCQAEAARRAIAHQKEKEAREGIPSPLGWQGVTVHFAVDPCA